MYPEYVLIRASRFLKVAPWDLQEQSSYWRDWGLECERADNLVEAAAWAKSRTGK